jgi:DNA-binding IclR family transcriptional regulator
VLRGLVEQTGESSSFNVKEGELRVCVYRVDSPHKIRDHVRVGDLLPLQRGAAGKVMLAFSQEATQEKWRELRETCFCCTKGEIEQDTAAVAAPVFGVGDTLQGALAITGPGFRFSDERVEAMRLPLLRAALALTRDFGGPTATLEAAVHGAATRSAAHSVEGR